MSSLVLARLHKLKPWENVNEEDLFRVDGLFLSIRGNVRRPEGVWCSESRHHAERWILAADEGPADEDWSYDAERRALSAGQLDTVRVESALTKVLNHFESIACDGVEFPVSLHPPVED